MTTTDHPSARQRRHKKAAPLDVSSGHAADDALSSSPSSTHHNSNTKKNETRRRRRRRNFPEQQPFWQLFLQVAIVLFILCVVSFHAYQWLYPPAVRYYVGDDDDFVDAATNSQQQQAAAEAQEKELLSLDKTIISLPPRTAPPIPHFNLSDASSFDAYGIVDYLNLIQKEVVELPSTNHNNHNNHNTTKFWSTVQELRTQFSSLYGGENAARMILDQGLSTFRSSSEHMNIPLDVIETACRMKHAKQAKRPFRFAFAGYSVTAGRGNYFRQSFPFVLERLLKPLFHLAGLDMEVRNAAIGGCPAFPYGWCLDHFLGTSPDVISWDYAMNEAGGVPEGLEAYVRHTLSRWNHPRPKLIVKDTHMAYQRRNILSAYAKLLKDPVVIHTDPATGPFLRMEEEFRPKGFQEWRKFGSPRGAPGQALHHPAVKEHELIGWMISMHFLSSLQVFVAQPNIQCPVDEEQQPGYLLPSPKSGAILNVSMSFPPVLFGRREFEYGWTMNPVHCRTTFQPRLSGDLSDVIVSGGVGEDIDLLLPKSQMYYNKGWTFDLSEGEKSALRKLSVFDHGLGFMDSKPAYYGLKSSGRLTMLLPYIPKIPSAPTPSEGDLAGNWFKSLVICEVNEKRDSGACNSETDVGYIVGGVNVTNSTMMTAAGTLFLGKKLCMNIEIPATSKLTTRKQHRLREERSRIEGLGENQVVASDNSKDAEDEEVGLLVEVFVLNHRIVHIDQTCSVSHVIWEQINERETPPT